MKVWSHPLLEQSINVILMQGPPQWNVKMAAPKDSSPDRKAPLSKPKAVKWPGPALKGLLKEFIGVKRLALR